MTSSMARKLQKTRGQDQSDLGDTRHMQVKVPTWPHMTALISYGEKWLHMLLGPQSRLGPELQAQFPHIPTWWAKE